MVKFWKVSERYGQFSNFYRAPIVIDGVSYPTTEHYFQSQKFLDPQIREHIRKQPTPKDAANEGRRKDLPLRQDWEQVKEDVMYDAIRAKFEQHPHLRRLLVESEGKIIEDSPKDPYWGVGKNGNGENRLGVLLMQLRDALQREDDVKE